MEDILTCLKIIKKKYSQAPHLPTSLLCLTQLRLPLNLFDIDVSLCLQGSKKTSHKGVTVHSGVRGQRLGPKGIKEMAHINKWKLETRNVKI